MATLTSMPASGPAATTDQVDAYIAQYRPVGPVELFLVRRLATQAARYERASATLTGLLASGERQVELDEPWLTADDAHAGTGRDGPPAWKIEEGPYPAGADEPRLRGTMPLMYPEPIRRTVSYMPVPYRAGIVRRQRETAEREFDATLRELRKLQARRSSAGSARGARSVSGGLRVLR
jgi:hypothetical protein